MANTPANGPIEVEYPLLSPELRSKKLPTDRFPLWHRTILSTQMRPFLMSRKQHLSNDYSRKTSQHL